MKEEKSLTLASLITAPQEKKSEAVAGGGEVADRTNLWGNFDGDDADDDDDEEEEQVA